MRAQEFLTGSALIENKQEIKHEGLLLTIEGLVDLRFNLRSVSFMDTFYGSNKTISLIEQTREIKKPGRLQPGLHRIP